ncbi:hypothetical protein LY76DRAFT_142723 [Colletotrichum caudatum]|nr:hypothetical protein LY76DRAFT_142723 [Colletotrichum caudatum]
MANYFTTTTIPFLKTPYYSCITYLNSLFVVQFLWLVLCFSLSSIVFVRMVKPRIGRFISISSQPRRRFRDFNGCLGWLF